MKDPIGSFDAVRDSAIRYVRTQFSTRFPRIDDERNKLLQTGFEGQEPLFAQEPLIEPVPRYASGEKLEAKFCREKLNFDERQATAFESLGGILMNGFPMYQHQQEMLEKVSEGHHAVITSGTGSGKTESFLLPILASLSAESSKWEEPELQEFPLEWSEDDPRRWWREENQERVNCRKGEKRTAAVRALVLYPMNALVEDQLTRLRKLMCCGEATTWYREHANSNRIYFGRYNGETPVPGSEIKRDGRIDVERRKKLRNRLKEMEETAEAVRAETENRSAGNQADYRESEWFFPRPGTSEMLSRWDMQECPPDILISNYSMLSIMLMRDEDSGIFDATKRWIEESETHVFHLVIDELHLYRGTAGTEVALLIRLLLSRLGLLERPTQLRILASSASLETGTPEENSGQGNSAYSFLTGFFGPEFDWNLSGQNLKASQGVVISGSISSPVEHDPTIQLTEAAECFSKIANEYSAYENSLSEGSLSEDIANSHSHDDLMGRITKLLNQNSCLVKHFKGEGTETLSIDDLFNPERDSLSSLLWQACYDFNLGKTRAKSASDLAKSLFPSTEEKLAREALRGLLIARGFVTGSSKAPAYRVHWLFRNVDGLWGCLNPNITSLLADEWIQEGEPGSGVVGKLSLKSDNTLLTENGKSGRMVELLYCEQCGQIFFGGGKYKSEID
ncbi:MAG: hypothetical protein RLZ87_1070, partial [Armatimonadota bacterium]